MAEFNETDNAVLDRIIAGRRSTRSFDSRMPERSDIEAVIDAGMKAPFASVSAGDVEIFRRFYPMARGNELLPAIDSLIKDQSRTDLESLRREMVTDGFLRDHGDILQGLWSMVAEKGLPGFLDVPYVVIAAEWAGARRAERQSLAHVMENMWLKATALNLGFCLVSPIESMSNNEDFCRLFDLPAGRYGFHGCLIGYPKSAPGKRTGVNGRVDWI